MNLADYQSKYSDIITEIKPWQSPNGSPDPNRQSLLKNGMGRLINVDDQMNVTTVGKDGGVGLDPEFKMEDRLMNGRTTPSPRPKQRSGKKSQEFYLVHDVTVNSIIEDSYFQMRADGVKWDVVVQYANIMKENDPDGWMAFPEILLMKDIGSLKYYVIGGHHRLAAMKENGYETINAICFDGDRRDGIIRAANENSDRSQRRTHEDIKHVCRTLIKTFPDWGFGQLAKWGGVDRNTIERHYKEMQQEGIAPDRPDQLRYITRHGTEATRKGTRDTKPCDEYADISTEDLVDRWGNLSDEVYKFAIEKNGLPPGNFLIDEGMLRSHAGKHHPDITHDMVDLMDADSIFIREKVVDQIKIWSDFVQQAETASKIFRAMLANFDYEIEPFGKRFPDPEECNWIVGLGLPAVHAEIRQRTLNTYENLKTSRGLGNLPFIDNDRESFYEHAEKQYPQHLVDAHPALNTESDRESNLQKIQTWHALGKDISDDADWVVAVRDGLVLKRQAKRDRATDKLMADIKAEREKSELEQGLTDAAEKEEKPPASDKFPKTREEAYDRYVKAADAVYHYWNQHAPDIPYSEFQAEIQDKKHNLAEQVGAKFAQGEYTVNDLQNFTWQWQSIETGIKAALDGEYNWISVFIKERRAAKSEEIESADTKAEEEKAEPLTYDLIQVRSKCRGVMTTAEHDFEQLKQKYNLQATFQDFYVYACEHFEEKRNLDLSRYVDGLRSIERLRELCEMWQGIAADLRRKADWVQAFYVYTPEYINSFEATEPEQPAALQIKPLGPSKDNSQTETDNPAEVKAFMILEFRDKARLRTCQGYLRDISEIEGIPDTIATLSEALHKALADYVE